MRRRHGAPAGTIACGFPPPAMSEPSRMARVAACRRIRSVQRAAGVVMPDLRRVDAVQCERSPRASRK